MYECKLHMNNILFVQIMQVKAKNNRQFNRKVGFLHLTTLLHSNYWGWGLKGTLKKGLYHTQSFSAYSLLVFPVLLSRNSVLKRSQILSLWPQTCTTFSQHNIPALKNWEKKELTLGKTFLTANLDNYSNKILLFLVIKHAINCVLKKQMIWQR